MLTAEQYENEVARLAKEQGKTRNEIVREALSLFAGFKANPTCIAVRTDENWIPTFSGIRYWPTDPRPEDVRLIDVAHHLANICRFTGATRGHYSVAQHCVLMSELAAMPDHLRMVALLHDAAEAYTGDFARPVKYTIPDMNRLDMLNTAAVEVAFGVKLEPKPPEVRQADLAMLVAERMQLLSVRFPMKRAERARPASVWIRPWGPEEAKERYLKRFMALKLEEYGWQGGGAPEIFEPETESGGLALR